MMAVVRFIAMLLGFPVPLDLPQARVGDDPLGDPPPEDDVPPTPRPMKRTRPACTCGRPALRMVVLPGLDNLWLCQHCMTRMAWATNAHLWCGDKRPVA